MEDSVRTIAQQIGPPVQVATAPHQFAMSTRAHLLQARTDQDHRATVLSIDGIGAFDLMSRESMVRGLSRVEGGDRVLPFVRKFYGSPTHIWQQGDALMPALFSLGQHPAFEAVQSQFIRGGNDLRFLGRCLRCVLP